MIVVNYILNNAQGLGASEKKIYILYSFLGGGFSDAHIPCETMYKCCLTLTKLIDQ